MCAFSLSCTISYTSMEIFLARHYHGNKNKKKKQNKRIQGFHHPHQLTSFQSHFIFLQKTNSHILRQKSSLFTGVHGIRVYSEWYPFGQFRTQKTENKIEKPENHQGKNIQYFKKRVHWCFNSNQIWCPKNPPTSSNPLALIFFARPCFTLVSTNRIPKIGLELPEEVYKLDIKTHI